MDPLPATGLQPANAGEVFLSPLTWNFISLSSLQHPPDSGQTQIKLDTLQSSLILNCHAHISPHGWDVKVSTPRT